MANSITNNGSAMDTKFRVPMAISRLNRRSALAIEKAIEKEIAKRKETQRVLEKMADMEVFMRGEICSKKIKIFNQQKHYTKKTMYADDMRIPISKSEFQQNYQF